MANFVPQVPASSPAQLLALAVGVNAALRGDTANIGRVDCAAGETSVTVTSGHAHSAGCGGGFGCVVA